MRRPRDPLKKPIPCPLCGGEFPIPVHRKGTIWTFKELYLVRRLHSIGLTYEGVGKLFGVSGMAIRDVLERHRVDADLARR